MDVNFKNTVLQMVSRQKSECPRIVIFITVTSSLYLLFLLLVVMGYSGDGVGLFFVVS